MCDIDSKSKQENEESIETEEDEDVEESMFVTTAKGTALVQRLAGGELVYVRADGTRVVKEEKDDIIPISSTVSASPPPPKRNHSWDRKNKSNNSGNLASSNSNNNLATQVGDWTCKCGFVNWGSKNRSICHQCKQPMPTSHQHTKLTVDTSSSEVFQQKLRQSLERFLPSSDDTTEQPVLAGFINSPLLKTKRNKRRLGIPPIAPPSIEPLMAKPTPVCISNASKPVMHRDSSPDRDAENDKKERKIQLQNRRQADFINNILKQQGGQNSGKILNQITQIEEVTQLQSKTASSTKRTRKNVRKIGEALQLTLSDLVVDYKEPLGEGAFGCIYRCWVGKSGQDPRREYPRAADLKALKVMRLDVGGCKEEYLKNITAADSECASWLQLTSTRMNEKKIAGDRHVLTLLKNFQKDGQFQMLMEFMHFGSLDDLMKTINQISIDDTQEMVRTSRDGINPMDRLKDYSVSSPCQEDNHPLPECVLSYIMEAVVMGLDFLHSIGIVHQDIKPGNILIDNWAQVKIGDFGLAGIMHQGTINQEGGTRLYMPPEKIRDTSNRKGTFAGDIWSLGVSTMECALGLYSQSKEHLFAGCGLSHFKISKEFDPRLLDSNINTSTVSISDDVLRETVSWESMVSNIHENEKLSARYNALSDELKDFVQNCMSYNPTERPPAKALKTHKFISDRKWKKREMKQFLDLLVDRLETQDMLSGGKGDSWKKRGWEPAKAGCSTASAISSRSTMSSNFGAAMHHRGRGRGGWWGSWRGRHQNNHSGRGGNHRGATRPASNAPVNATVNNGTTSTNNNTDNGTTITPSTSSQRGTAAPNSPNPPPARGYFSSPPEYNPVRDFHPRGGSIINKEPSPPVAPRVFKKSDGGPVVEVSHPHDSD